MLESLAKANPISKAISKAISDGLTVERTKTHKGKGDCRDRDRGKSA
jgi:hypothetical protein